MRVTNIAQAAQEAERFLAAVKLWRAAKILTLSESDRLLVAAGKSAKVPYATIYGKEHAAVQRASLDLTRALAKMRNEV